MMSSAVKFLVALAGLLVVSVIPAERWPLLVAVLAVMWGALSLVGVPGRMLLRRLLQFSPFLLGLAFAGAFSRPGESAGLWIAGMMLRCLAALAIGLWLVHVLTAREFLQLLAQWRLPTALITTLSFMLRYLVLLWDEHERLRSAQLSRAGGPAPGWPQWRAAVERLGSLLVRALDRADRTHRAMVARGWDGTATWRE
jgi:cobalt/nickel transport system permease protein